MACRARHEQHAPAMCLPLLAALLATSVPPELAGPLLPELAFGVSAINAVAGHGGLTAGVSADGDLTLLSWPGPSLYDQLAWFGANGIDARSLPHAGAHDGMGAQLGLYVTTASGTQLTFLRDGPWSHLQRYSAPLAPVPVTVFARADLGLTVTLTDVVAPDADVLTRHVRVERGAGSPVTAVALALYENLQPTLSRIAYLPIGDWAFPARSDFAALWDESAQAILHFRPGDRAKLTAASDLLSPPADDYGPVDALMKQTAPDPAAVAALAAGFDASFAPGVVGLVSTEPAPASHQVGIDATPLCTQVGKMVDNLVALPSQVPGITLPIDALAISVLRCADPLPGIVSAHGWQFAPQDARASLLAGTLPGSPVAAAQTNGALVTQLAFDSTGVAEGSALFAFGATRARALAALSSAKAQPFAARLAASEGAAQAALGGAALPDPALGARVVEVATRALVNVYVARDRATGAIVASVARQPSYQLDWPRDGAFISAALDIAGLGGWVTRRHEWYAGLARKKASRGDPLLAEPFPADPDTGQQAFPAGAWEMNYFSDGAPGGPIGFEIDNTALHLWSTAVHAASLHGSDRSAFVAAVWPASRAALELLVRWRDPQTGLPAPANEDDSSALTSGLHGASAVYAALIAGERLARLAGDSGEADRCGARAADLARAIEAAYFDAASGLWRVEKGGAAGGHGGATGWLAWPARLLHGARLEAQLSADLDAALVVLRGQASGGSYLAKKVVPAALYGAETGSRAKAREAVQLLASIATPDTAQFGEVYLNGAAGWEARVAAPHIWEGVLFYLSAMALSSPARFNADETLPLSSGCGCQSGETGAIPELAALLGVAAFATRRRRAVRASAGS
jgi:MYXO-CTERM domain-containing protein